MPGAPTDGATGSTTAARQRHIADAWCAAQCSDSAHGLGPWVWKAGLPGYGAQCLHNPGVSENPWGVYNTPCCPREGGLWSGSCVAIVRLGGTAGGRGAGSRRPAGRRGPGATRCWIQTPAAGANPKGPPTGGWGGGGGVGDGLYGQKKPRSRDLKGRRGGGTVLAKHITRPRQRWGVRRQGRSIVSRGGAWAANREPMGWAVVGPRPPGPVGGDRWG